MHKVFDNILQTIGDTPLVRLNKVVAGLPCPVYAKIEYGNPGNSIKDRMALKMLEVAEKENLEALLLKAHRVIQVWDLLLQPSSKATNVFLPLQINSQKKKLIF
jgi:hypothetical protein